MSIFSQHAKQFKRDVKYINRDFGEFRRGLIDFARNYFPNTYNDRDWETIDIKYS